MSSRIIIFGASGNTGACCLKAALDLGHIVTTFVRDPSLLPSDLIDNVTVIQGDVTDQIAVEDALEGQDSVVITLGTRSDLSWTTVLSDGTRNILDGMNKHNIKRVSACVSAFLFWERYNVPERYQPLTEDHERMLDLLKESNLEWVAVMPPHITDTPGKGDYIVEVGRDPGSSISKHDLGHFLVACLGEGEYIGKCCGICDESQA